ncbi:hypothetical protein RUM44_000508 [Polyplax serrata]|uniref:Ig-like domain-containing protein n=1 Tax=Polyplax serrata TaxID=468196 RepID=A0ABR1B5M2_POLSC
MMSSSDSLVILYGLLSIISFGFSLRVLELHVPPVVDVRNKAVLVCQFDLEGDKFLSLKWYKEELEFFRYMPDFVPRIQTFKVDGINVVESESNMTSIVLNPLEYKSSGLYRCEVSAEAPHFKVVYSHANMSVLGYSHEKCEVFFCGRSRSSSSSGGGSSNKFSKEQ